MNVYLVDSVILVAANNPNEALELCKEMYGEAPGATLELVPLEKVNEVVFIRANRTQSRKELFENIRLKDLFDEAVINNTPKILIDALYDIIIVQ